jgi:hypothetical protein
VRLWDCCRKTFLVTVAERKVTLAEWKVSATAFSLVVLHEGRGNLTATEVYPVFLQDLFLSFVRLAMVVWQNKVLWKHGFSMNWKLGLRLCTGYALVWAVATFRYRYLSALNR